jgi:hypothetical protein
MDEVDSFPPRRAFVMSLRLAGVTPKILLRSLGAGAALAQPY